MKTEKSQQSCTEEVNDAITAKDEQSSVVDHVQSVMEKGLSDTIYDEVLKVYLQIIGHLKVTSPEATACRAIMEKFLEREDADTPDARMELTEALGSVIGRDIDPKWLYHRIHEPGMQIVFSDRIYFVDQNGSYRKMPTW